MMLPSLFLLLLGRVPQDYHRWHFPCTGRLSEEIPVPGSYFTVNPIAVRRPLDVYTANQRSVVLIETEHFGTVALVAVGT